MSALFWLAVGIVCGIIAVIVAAVLICGAKVKSHREWDE